MSWSDLPLRPGNRVLRQFAGAWLVVFLGLAAHQQFARSHPAAAMALCTTAIVVGGIGLVWPRAVRWIYVGATVLTFPVGWLMSQIVLLVMFYIVLTPIALLLRFRGRDLLDRRPAPDRKTLWHPKEPGTDAKRYLRQY